MTNSSEALEYPPKRLVLLAGAVAGIAVDFSLYPIDTIKSRLQSNQGFFRSGGFSNLYRGLTPVLVGSIPNASLFFITYETSKARLQQVKLLNDSRSGHIIGHVFAASLGEVVSCSVRVPYEILKMRSQTTNVQLVGIVKDILAKEGFVGLYRGFLSTILRDIPFSAVQYPIWELLKAHHSRRHHQQVNAFQSALYGSIAGAVAAFVTTPMDVAKSRIMLAGKAESLASGNVLGALNQIIAEKGIRGCFAGVVPRVIWISMGAAIFLGSYEKTLTIINVSST